MSPTVNGWGPELELYSFIGVFFHIIYQNACLDFTESKLQLGHNNVFDVME